MKPFLAGLIFFMHVAGSSAAAPSLPDPILLWPEGAPGATGSSPEDKPAVTAFLPDEKSRNGTAIVVIPGGGYTIRAVDHEGVLAAQWLRDHGYTAFLLRYRLNPLYEREHWVADGERAMRYIRAHARDYRIDPARIGALGFSAGSNLLVDLMLHVKPGDPAALDPVDRMSARPDFLVLGYGFMQIPQNADPKVLADFPPTFLYCTVEDRSNLLNMLTLQSTLVRSNVQVEAHFFQNGIHGTGFGLGDPVLGQWPLLLDNWARTNGLLTSGKRIALTGMLKLDGSPLQKGMLILRPRDDPHAPSHCGLSEQHRYRAIGPVHHSGLAGSSARALSGRSATGCHALGQQFARTVHDRDDGEATRQCTDRRRPAPLGRIPATA